MTKNNYSKTSMDIYKRDVQISMLTMQNSILKMQLKNSQTAGLYPRQETIQNLRHQFTHEVIDSFEKAFGFKVVSTSTTFGLDSFFNSSERETKSMKVTINYEGK